METRENTTEQLIRELARKHQLTVFAEGQIATQNKCGMQMGTTSPLLERWIAGYDGKHPLVDIGCAYGINTIAALRQGIPVVGIDLGEEHFPFVFDLYAAVKAQGEAALGQLTLLTGNVAQALPLAESSVASILIAEVLHFIPGAAAQAVFTRLYSKLTPGGILCLHCFHEEGLATLPNSGAIMAEIAERRARGVAWPGEMHDTAELMNMAHNYVDFPPTAAPDFFHLYSQVQVQELAEGAGFTIESLQAGFNPGYPTYLRGERSNLQLIARRPL